MQLDIREMELPYRVAPIVFSSIHMTCTTSASSVGVEN